MVKTVGVELYSEGRYEPERGPTQVPGADRLENNASEVSRSDDRTV